MGKIKLIVANWIRSDQGKDILTVLIIILVGLGSFGLGRLSKTAQNEGLRMEYLGQDLSGSLIEAPGSVLGLQNQTGADIDNKKFFASSRGKKYYPIGCSAGKSIKQSNRIYFETREAAETQGYELSTSCR